MPKLKLPPSMPDDDAASAVDEAEKPDLVVRQENLTTTVYQMRDLLAGSPFMFERGVPVRLINGAPGTMPQAHRLNGHGIVIETHNICRPVKIVTDDEGNEVPKPVTLPERCSNLYLALQGEWYLRPLAGITSAPLLADNGDIRTLDGYDADTGLWCHNVPEVQIPAEPSREEAEEALRSLRHLFRAFPFADAVTCEDSEGEYEVPVGGHLPTGWSR